MEERGPGHPAVPAHVPGWGTAGQDEGFFQP